MALVSPGCTQTPKAQTASHVEIVCRAGAPKQGFYLPTCVHSDQPPLPVPVDVRFLGSLHHVQVRDADFELKLLLQYICSQSMGCIEFN